MGLYDELRFFCPVCGMSQYVQLKIRDERCLESWTIGTKLDMSQIYPEYVRHLIDPHGEFCHNCGAIYVFNASNGTIQIEIWDGLEDMECPAEDYFLELCLDPEWDDFYNVWWLARLLNDGDIMWFRSDPDYDYHVWTATREERRSAQIYLEEQS